MKTLSGRTQRERLLNFLTEIIDRFDGYGRWSA